MILCDTDVLAYAVGGEHALREPCRRLVQSHADGLIDLTTTVEVLQEFAHVYARRRTRKAAAGLTRQYAESLEVLLTEPRDLALGLTLYEEQPRLGCFDALLAAVALNRHAEALISGDRAFGDVPGLRWFEPSTFPLP